jgi:hypothetical protein
MRIREILNYGLGYAKMDNTLAHAESGFGKDDRKQSIFGKVMRDGRSFR